MPLLVSTTVTRSQGPVAHCLVNSLRMGSALVHWFIHSSHGYLSHKDCGPGVGPSPGRTHLCRRNTGLLANLALPQSFLSSSLFSVWEVLLPPISILASPLYSPFKCSAFRGSFLRVLCKVVLFKAAFAYSALCFMQIFITATHTRS